MADKKAWIIYSEYGEYSDHTFKPLGVALTEEAARAAVEREARKEAARPWSRDVVRPSAAGDEGHEDGFWVALRDYASDKQLSAYNGELFGFQETAVAEDA